jgi:hypothetical protein
MKKIKKIFLVYYKILSYDSVRETLAKKAIKLEDETIFERSRIKGIIL